MDELVAPPACGPILLGMVLVMAFLALISIAARATISQIGQRLDMILPSNLTFGMLTFSESFVSFFVLFVLLAVMFRFLPDAKVPWRSVWFGALVTSTLFTVGKQLMGVYIEFSNPGEVYGAAGSLAIVLLWVYYASLILIFGAELTGSWTVRGSQS